MLGRPIADACALEIGALHLAMRLGLLGVGRGLGTLLLFRGALCEIDSIMAFHGAAPSVAEAV